MVIPENAELEFVFPGAFDPLLTSFDKTISCVLFQNVTQENGTISEIQ